MDELLEELFQNISFKTCSKADAQRLKLLVHHTELLKCDLKFC